MIAILKWNLTDLLTITQRWAAGYTRTPPPHAFYKILDESVPHYTHEKAKDNISSETVNPESSLAIPFLTTDLRVPILIGLSPKSQFYIQYKIIDKSVSKSAKNSSK